MDNSGREHYIGRVELQLNGDFEINRLHQYPHNSATRMDFLLCGQRHKAFQSAPTRSSDHLKSIINCEILHRYAQHHALEETKRVSSSTGTWNLILCRLSVEGVIRSMLFRCLQCLWDEPWWKMSQLRKQQMIHLYDELSRLDFDSNSLSVHMLQKHVHYPENSSLTCDLLSGK